MKKFFVGVVLSVLLICNGAFAMSFNQPVKVGEIGAPVQSPYSGFIIKDATFNDGAAVIEEFEVNGKPVKSYVRGLAKFGELCCKYNFEADFNEAMQFGGENNFVLTGDATYKEIFQIDGDGLTLYAIYHKYCTTDLKILDGRNVYVDSKKLSEKFFGGNDGYKLDGSVIYDVPTCAGDKIVVTYRRWHWDGESNPEGEFIFTWNDAAKNFSVKQIVY